MTERRISRREALRIIAATPVGLLVVGAPAVLGDREKDSPSIATAAAGAFAAVERSAALIGKAYLIARPAEADRDGLARSITAALESSVPGGAGRTYAVRPAVSERVRADFAAGRIVRVDGWLLSETEGRLCALVSLG